MDLCLRDKVALVSGGSKGIGLGIIRALIAEGARVMNVNRAGPEGLALADEFPRDSYRYLAADLREKAACQQAVHQTLSNFGQIDIVVNNAGANDGVGLERGPEDFTESLQRNLLHYYAIVHYAREALLASRGVIVNIGSKVSVTGQGQTS